MGFWFVGGGKMGIQLVVMRWGLNHSGGEVRFKILVVVVAAVRGWLRP